MILLLDIGNTRIKWARLEAELLGSHGAATHVDEQLNHVLERVFDGPAPTRVLAANVAGPQVAEALREICTRRYRLKPEFLLPTRSLQGVTNGYTDPKRLGSDRWAAAIAAFRNYGGPVCVVDAGTAITVDVVDASGRHLGGLIAPGPLTMRRALATATDALQDEGEGEIALLCRDTRSGISSGSWHAAAGFVERVAGLLDKEMDEVQYLLTGGDAETLNLQLTPRFVLCPDLVLQGLAVIAEGQP